jgi:L-threonylcarbamoyladenylate synthase
VRLKDSSPPGVRRVTPATLRAAAARLRRGGIVAFPTETVYGLGANALDARAVEKIFSAKGRPGDNPVIVHVSDLRMLRRVAAKVPGKARQLIRRFWPGPLTIVVPKRSSVPDAVTAGLPTVAVRMPDGIARDLVRLAGVPIAAPSANLSGRPSPTTAAHVAEDFPGFFVLDGGPTTHGLESTVVAFDPPRILRQGAVPEEDLKGFLGKKSRSAARGPRVPWAAPRFGAERPESPGTKYLHYAPLRPLILFRRRSALLAYAGSHPDALVLCPAWLAPFFASWRVVPLGDTIEEIARNLFAALRTPQKGRELLVLAVPRRGLGRAVMDRLERAASRIV